MVNADSPIVGASAPRKITAALIGLGSLAAFFFAAATGWMTPRYSSFLEGAARAAFLIVALAVGYLALRILMHLKPAQAQRERILQPDIDWLAQLQQDITSTSFGYGTGALIAFIELITSPAQYRSRVAETIDLEGRNINKRVSVEFVLPKNILDSESFYLPVLQPVKGDLVDNFRIIDGSGGSMTNLSYLETIELAAIGLRTLLIVATGIPYEKWTTTRAAELVLLELIARRGLSTTKSIKMSTRQGLRLLEGKGGKEAKDLIRTYLSSISAGYPIVAVVPKSLVVMNRVLVRYEQTIIPSSHGDGWGGKLRTGLGVRPSQVTIPVDLAQTAGSYHLRINGPPEKYVVEQVLRCADCRKLLRRAGRDNVAACDHANGVENPDDSHFRVRGRFGQNFTHLYMRGYANRRYRNIRFEMLVRFNETPPGSRASATVTAIAALIFIWVIGHLTADHESVTNSDLPAILLALPAIAASWFGLAAGTDALVGSSLHARLSLIISGILSIASVIIYLLQSASAIAASTQAHPRHVTLAGVTSTPWVVLMIIAFLGFLYILWHLLARVRNYMSLIRRTDPLSQDHLVL